MRRKYIALLDSGVGGLSVLKELIKHFPNKNYIYIGDNENNPYGNKSIKELKNLTINNLIMLNYYDIEFLIVACNTLSASIITFIKDFCSFPVYGIYPPVEFALINNYKVNLLSTVVTANKYKNNKNLIVLPQINLAKNIEENIFSLNKFKTYEYIKKPFFSSEVLILGCTHYNFIKKNIFDHFKPKKVICSEDFIVRFLNRSHKIEKSLVIFKRNHVLFLGKSKKINHDFYYKVVKKQK